jgi:WD40 repeat protein
MGPDAAGASAIAFTRNGNSILAAYDTGKIGIWDIAAQRFQVVGTFGKYSPEYLTCSSDGRFVAVTDGLENITIWELGTLKEFWSLTSHVHPVTRRQGIKGIVFHPDGRTLVTAGADGMVRLWNVPEKKSIRYIDGNVGGLYALALSPDGKMIAVVGSRAFPGHKFDGIHILNFANGEPLGETAPFKNPVSCTCFSPDGKYVAVGTAAFDEDDVGTGEIHMVPVAGLIRQ